MARSRSPRKVVQRAKKLKEKYKNVPSHFLFNIDSPIDYQCPIIDENIDKLKDCKNLLKSAFEAKTLEGKDALILSAFYKISKLDDHLDQVTRKNYEELREYADQWKKLALDAINKSNNPEEFLKIKWK